MTLDTERHGRVLLVTLNRPHRLNAYDRAMVDELRTTWTEFGRDDTLHAAVVTGAGTTGFCTGFDVDDTLAAGVTSPSLDYAGRVALTAKDVGVMKPVVAAVNGYCTAGGWHFVNDADVVLCSETATFFDTHHDVGIANPVEAVGALSRLPLGEVMRMVLTGRDYRIDAARGTSSGSSPTSRPPTTWCARRSRSRSGSRGTRSASSPPRWTTDARGGAMREFIH